jgi:tRNA-dihydrouridine synthase B
MCREQGAGLCFTEMIPAIALTYGANDARRRVKCRSDDHPIAVQIEGRDPEIMGRAAAMAEEAGADFVDVNAGCPSRRVTNGGAGSALLSDLATLERIMKAVRASVAIPVTLKVRSGPSAGHIVLEEIAQLAIDCGLAGITLHPRTRSQGFRGSSEWPHIARLKSMVSIPVIGNGDVVAPADGIRMMATTSCDGVMIGRGAIGNPWLFAGLMAAWKGEPPVTRPMGGESWRRTVVRHYDLLSEDLGGDDRIAAKMFRKHLARYARGMRGAVALRRSLSEVGSRGTLMAAIRQVVEDEVLLPPLEGPLPDDDIVMEEP